MKKGWWQQEIAGHLQQFYEDFVAGKRPKLVIQSPPQHGKSEQVVDFISWVCGKNPDLRVIYTSFSDRLGVRANLRMQRLLDSAKYQRVFPDLKINARNVATVSAQVLRNREILEFIGREGYFRNTTVNGSITGEGLDIGVIDDPVKGREEASSETIRDKTWDWFTDDFFTRFSEHAGLLAILTRWHVDDPIGRFIERMPGVKVVSYPAIATEDEEHRQKGEALFPELKSLEFLLERKGIMFPPYWEALYQQNPIIQEGELFKPDQIGIIDALPTIRTKWVRRLLTGYADDEAALRVKLKTMLVYMGWGGSVTSLGNVSVRYLLIDELDKCPEFPSKKEARFEALVAERTTAYDRFGSLKIWNSTPTASPSRIVAKLREMDVVFDYHARCPDCGHIQLMEFKRIDFNGIRDPQEMLAGDHARYVCAACGSVWDDRKRDIAVRTGAGWYARGLWQNPGRKPNHLWDCAVMALVAEDVLQLKFRQPVLQVVPVPPKKSSTPNPYTARRLMSGGYR